MTSNPPTPDPRTRYHDVCVSAVEATEAFFKATQAGLVSIKHLIDRKEDE